MWRWGQPAEGRLPSLTTGRAPLSHTPHKPPPVSHHLLSRTRPHSHRPRSASRALHPSSHPLRRQSPRPQAAFNTGGGCVCVRKRDTERCGRTGERRGRRDPLSRHRLKMAPRDVTASRPRPARERRGRGRGLRARQPRPPPSLEAPIPSGLPQRAPDAASRPAPPRSRRYRRPPAPFALPSQHYPPPHLQPDRRVVAVLLLRRFLRRPFRRGRGGLGGLRRRSGGGGGGGGGSVGRWPGCLV